MTVRVMLERPMRLLSMGWGVQSWTLAAMSVVGVLERFDAIVNADTGYESEATYNFKAKWSGWLVDRGANVVSLGRKRTEVWTVKDLTKIPAFTVSQSAAGARRGMKQRSCTRDWKVRPQNVWTRKEMRRLGVPLLPGAVRKALGISLDEFERAKHSELSYIVHEYPLLDMRMTRADCVQWLRANGLAVPPKSACVFCPYTNSRRLHMSVNRPGADFENAVRADNMIRDAIGGMKLYVSDRTIPLEDISADRRGGDFEQVDFLEQCDSGHCFL